MDTTVQSRQVRSVSRAWAALLTVAVAVSGQNAISRDDFNFGHQSGYMYCRSDSAWGNAEGGWAFATGLLAYYTPEMPLVRNPAYRSRLMLLVPLRFEFFPCGAVTLQIDLTDLFVEFPFERLQWDAGGKSPRVRTKVTVVQERRIMPAMALTLGVTWSSAKPYTVWANRHNYDSSDGLAGSGTGVADYLIRVDASKRVNRRVAIHAHVGLAPLGSPVPRRIGEPLASANCQADEIPYGAAVDIRIAPGWLAKLELAGMYNGLRSTRLAHYSMLRLEQVVLAGPLSLCLDLERGLTWSSDTWVAGVEVHARMRPRKP